MFRAVDVPASTNSNEEREQSFKYALTFLALFSTMYVPSIVGNLPWFHRVVRHSIRVLPLLSSHFGRGTQHYVCIPREWERRS